MIERQFQFKPVRHAKVEDRAARVVSVTQDQNPVSSVQPYRCRGAVARIIRSNDLIHKSLIIVAAVRRGQMINLSGLHGLLHTVDRHGLDTRGHLLVSRRVADHEADRAWLPVIGVLGGILHSIRNSLGHRRRGVLRQHNPAYGALLFLVFPLSGNMLTVRYRSTL